LAADGEGIQATGIEERENGRVALAIQGGADGTDIGGKLGMTAVHILEKSAVGSQAEDLSLTQGVGESAGRQELPVFQGFQLQFVRGVRPGPFWGSIRFGLQ